MTTRSARRQATIGEDANWATDGHVLMNPDSQVKFLSRGFLQLAAYVFRQVDPKLDLRINPEKFMDCIEYVNTDGVVVSPPSWPGAPENAEVLNNQLLDWVSHCESRSSIIPSLFDQDWETVRNGIEEGELGLPRLVRPGTGGKGENSSSFTRFFR